MSANTQSQGLLRSYAETVDGCSVVEGKSAIEFLIRKCGLTITIALPNDVKEWFVDVEDSATGAKARDWYDYAGYDSRAKDEELDRDMAADLRDFVENVLRNPLRMRVLDRRKASAVLESEVDGKWQGLVPADVVV